MIQVSIAATGQVASADAAANLNFSPSGFTAQGEDHALVEDLDPSAPILGLVGQTDDLGAPQTAGEADRPGSVTVDTVARVKGPKH